MHMTYSFISLVFLLLSILPLILIQFTHEYFTLLTFGQTGLIGVLMPIFYGLISFILIMLTKKGTLRMLVLIFGAMSLFLNVIIAFVAIFGFRGP
ncbi:hypothetical protein G4V62_12565 [Bacillaceae bacterium SIJ1]|uniref:hypothetical protein n=1 Tax=Litoribacterium kuwaitense TaxID=1398745 RepID=UPI0013EC7BDB|nr:hypothetical protein [Litoribacterium kuwaitense]NGP45746.1 hypothetical protein [Litoribacterium kuwaitense]